MNWLILVKVLLWAGCAWGLLAAHRNALQRPLQGPPIRVLGYAWLAGGVGLLVAGSYVLPALSTTSGQLLYPVLLAAVGGYTSNALTEFRAPEASSIS